MNVYGSELFNYNNNNVTKLYTAWRKSIRQVFNIDYRTHNFIVYGIAGNVEIKFHKKLAKFIFNMIHSENQFVTKILMHLFKTSSSIAENYRLLSYRYSISPVEWEKGVNCVIRKVRSPISLSDQQIITISVVKELISMRDDLNYNFASKAEIKQLLYEVCRN